MKPRSLRVRLIASAVVSILAAVGLFGVAAVAIVENELHTSLDNALRQRAQNVARLSVSAPAVLTAPGSLEAPAGGRQIAVQVIDARGRILARSDSLGARLLPKDRLVDAAIERGASGFEDIDLSGDRLRLYSAPIADAGGPAAGGAVIVASDMADITNTTRHLRRLLAISALAAAVLAGLMAGLLTRRGLKPLRDLSAGARRIGQSSDSSRRLPSPAAHDEVADLTNVLNGMLAALDLAQENERRFLADASHELRTPVAALLGNVEYISRHGVDPAVLADLRSDAIRLGGLVDDLLVLERQAGPSPSFGPIRLDRLVAQVAATSDRVELGRLDEATVEGDADELRRALGNLVENALTHGPANTPVEISLLSNGGVAAVTVQDQGPGPSESEREHLFERFWRSPSAMGRPGSGLGLPITKSIIERHKGSISVDGSAFTIELPAIQPG